MNILISRTDNIGDVILTFPLVGYLKSVIKDCNIFFLGKNYTEDLVQNNPNIDHFINFSKFEKLKEEFLIKELKHNKIDVIIHVFPSLFIAKAAYKAQISMRIGTAGRVHHWIFCNKKVSFSRKKSNLHESQLNFKLLGPLGFDQIPSVEKLSQYYGFSKPFNKNSKLKIILHSKSFGSAVDWDLKNYIKLVKLSIEKHNENIMYYFSGTEQESKLISSHIKDIVDDVNIFDYTGKFDLKEFIEFIGSCDALIACSTGPLHIAASLGLHAIGLYSSHRPLHAGRWAPIGVRTCTLSAADLASKVPCIDSIEVESVLEQISNILEKS
jgi:heptosyltransferase III